MPDANPRRLQLPDPNRPVPVAGIPLSKILKFKNQTFEYNIATGTLTAHETDHGSFVFAFGAEEIEELRAMLRSISKGVD